MGIVRIAIPIVRKTTWESQELFFMGNFPSYFLLEKFTVIFVCLLMMYKLDFINKF